MLSANVNHRLLLAESRHSLTVKKYPYPPVCKLRFLPEFFPIRACFSVL